MEDYTKHWPEFMKSIDIGVALDNWEELDRLANQYNEDLEALKKEQIKQDLNYKIAGINKSFDFESKYEAITSKAKIAVQDQLEKSRVEELKHKKNEIPKTNGNKESSKQDQSKLSKEEKFAEEQVNARDITGTGNSDPEKVKADPENEQDPDPEKAVVNGFKEQKDDLEIERAKFIAEMREAKERNNVRDWERKR